MKHLRSILAGAALLAAQPCHAWHSAGHSATGSIAYAEIKDDPELVKRVVATLKGNPDFVQRSQGALASSGVVADEYYFMRAATWPDEVRRTHFDVPSAHYVNKKFTPPGTGTGQLTPAANDVLKALAAHRQTLSTSQDPEQRGIALAWLFHLVGDVHQPLHSIALVNGSYPKGDRGGNAFAVVPITDFEDQDNLHSFWDGFWDGLWGKTHFNQQQGFWDRSTFAPSKRFPAVHDLAGTLTTRLPRSSFMQLPGSFDPPAWAKESYDAAIKFAYNDQGVLLPFGHSGAPDDPGTPTVLSPTYRDVALRNAEPRLVLAGYRLADTLKELKPVLVQGSGAPVHPVAASAATTRRSVRRPARVHSHRVSMRHTTRHRTRRSSHRTAPAHR